MSAAAGTTGSGASTPAAGTAGSSDEPDRYDLGHGTRALHVEHYELELDYRVRTNRLDATATLRIRTLEAVKALELDLADLTVQSVAVTGAILARYRHRAGRLTVRLTDTLPSGSVVEVTIGYAGTPRPVRSPFGEVGWEELEDGVIVASQPTGASSWFPCNDRPGDRSTYRTSITVEQPYRAHAHGTLTRRSTGASTTTWVFDEPHPTPTYLATVQVGRYTEVDLGTEPVPQRALVPAAQASLARTRLHRHAEMMRLFTDLFGPYPLAEYTLVVTPDELEIPVEAQGMAIFGVNHLRGDSGGDRLVPHELAHQWFGNAVSVAGWQHIWLNEGFACYAEWLWSEASGGPTAHALAREHRTRLTGLAQDLVLADPGVDDLFDDRVYKRGALTLHALRLTLGEETYTALVRAWTARHADTPVTTADFRALAAEHAAAAGDGLVADVEDLLTAWLDRPELPPLPDADEPGHGVAGLLGQLRRAVRTAAPS
ncbi:M1 family metallopeptidase [uncultured Cellulomonas sp.]|uniref:M1 family metallopeptidase n=1 Tax=uncultured Cellulomonas sp. TaxID=189682 RepID=UPI00260CAC2D|nr:M1 family metallopeptidase [uncultured Cellulomonas sp.]